MCIHLPFCRRPYVSNRFKATIRGLACLLTWCCLQLSLEQPAPSCSYTLGLEAHGPGGFPHYSQIHPQGSYSVLKEKAKNCLKCSNISHTFHFYFYFFPTQSLSLQWANFLEARGLEISNPTAALASNTLKSSYGAYIFTKRFTYFVVFNATLYWSQGATVEHI